MVWSICVFAHNEERGLPGCIGAFDAAADGGAWRADIIENGSTDGTARVARALASADPRLAVHQLALPDKANAWNEYAHRLGGAADVHIFIDGDVRPAKGAFRALARALAASPRAHAAAALPGAGRARKAWARKLFDEACVSGNLYAVRGAAIAIMRAREIRLPVGAFGEDGLLSYLFLTDLMGGPDDSHTDRIVVADDAFFEFDSLAPNARDLNIYRNRLRRYSKRYFQNEILYDILKAGGVAAMPADISAIFTTQNLARMRPRLDPENFFFDLAMLRRLRREAKGRR